MPSVSELVIIAIAALSIVAFALLLAPSFVWTRRRFSSRARQNAEASAEGMADSKGGSNEAGSRAMVVATAHDDPDLPPAPDLPQVAPDPTLEDRVIRVVSWAFLMAVAVFAAASGVWPDALAAIVILIAVTGEALLLLQDVLPRTPFKRAKGPLQAMLALVFASTLVALTGGLESPFTFTFPLIVGAGALLVAPRVALALAVLATAAYLAAGLVVDPTPEIGSLVTMAVNLTGVYLLAYIGASVGREQRRARDAAIRLSTVDSLTGLYNRSYFFTALEREIARGDRSGRAFCLVMLDLDDLKSVNDRFGHIAGDQVLRSVADIVRGGVRKIDTPARYGGDEFVALLPETDPTGGWVVAEKIRQTVAEQGLPGVEPGPTVSVGVVSYPADGRSADALLVSADRAMYASKRGGKNRVARAAAEPMAITIAPMDPPARSEGERAG
ncbi:MAG TPA: GGDEF domain-containing protein [Candidatus Limnocylindrales bacterium]|nr:GGDEF domain-containing protein [Candidatus Limnocylindrales bacterium]